MSRDMRSDPPASLTPPRLWNVEEANARRPSLGELLDTVRSWAVRLRDVHSELRRLTDFWGAEIDAPDHADHDLKNRLEAEWRNLSRRIDESIQSLRSEGIEVKALDTGLVDFYGLLGGELVLLCWRRDEPAVAFYHTLAGGFRSRRPIPVRTETAVSRARPSS